MPARTSRAGPYVIAAALGLIGLAVIGLTMMAPTSPMYARVGPTAFPYAIGVILILMSALLALDAAKDRWHSEATDHEATGLDFKAIGLVIAGFLAAMALVRWAGFIIGSTALFTLATLAFGERRVWWSVPIGFLIAFITYFVFARLLGLRMGGGLIEGFI